MTKHLFNNNLRRFGQYPDRCGAGLRMWSWDNILPWRLLPGHNAVTLLAALALLGHLAVAAQGQDTENDQESQIIAPLVDRSHAKRVYRLIEKWIRDGGKSLDQPERKIMVQGMGGIHVTLRSMGRTLGHAEVPYDSYVGTPQAPVDLVQVARIATGTALQQVKSRMARQAARAAQAVDTHAGADPPKPVDPLVFDFIARHLVVDLQIAKAPEPIRLNSKAPPDAVLDTFAPGYHGLRMALPGVAAIAGSAWSWPATNLAHNRSPKSQLLRLLTNLGLKRDLYETVGRTNGLRLERFEVIHLVRADVREPVVLLVRGNRPVPTTSVSGATLHDMARRMAEHLAKRQREDGAMTRIYRPARQRHELDIASLKHQALAAYAMARWMRLTTEDADDSRPPVRVDLAVQRAVQNIMNLTFNQSDQREPDQPVSMALAIMTILHTPSLAARKNAREMLAEELMAGQAEDGAFGGKAQGKTPNLTQQDQAIILFALTDLYRITRNEQLAGPIHRANNWFAKKDQDTDPLAIAWLALANRQIDVLNIPSLPPDGNQPPAAKNWSAQIKALAEMLMEQQIQSDPAIGPPDVVGGFDERAAGLETPPCPDWRSAYGLRLFAIALSDQDIMGQAATEAKLIRSSRLAARFLAQLMFFDPSCFYIRWEDEVLGGIRVSLWNNELRVEATATALLAVVELTESLRQVARRRSAAAGMGARQASGAQVLNK